MIKIEIKSIFGNVLFTYECENNTIKNTIEKANLEGTDLRSADLRSANLRGVNLEGIDLRSADLRSANLEGAKLRGADLRSADLRSANLEGVDLRSTNLIGVDLRSTNLIGANLEGANLKLSDLRSTNLRSTNLQGANLQGAKLRGADLRLADLRSAKNIPDSYTNLCMRDMIYVMKACINEVPYLRQAIIDGRINGTQYEGDCCCLIGSLSVAKGISDDELCNHIPLYNKGLHNYSEQWFYQIRQGDNPETSYFSKKALEACDIVLSSKKKS